MNNSLGVKLAPLASLLNKYLSFGRTPAIGGHLGGGGGNLHMSWIWGCAIILGTFLGVAPGFLGIIFW